MDTQNRFWQKYGKLLSTIAEHHSMLSLRWIEFCSCHNINLFNQRQRKVYQILEDSTLSEAIIEYQNFLVSEIASTNIAEQLEMLGASSSRIKGRNSIENKIDRYIFVQDEHGHSPINKCLNDIWGIRVITNEEYNLKEIQNVIESKTFSEKLRAISSIKEAGAYKAIHVYFSHGNNTFDCELQIWYKKFVESNELSHRRHKQQYTLWESVLKEDGNK